MSLDQEKGGDAFFLPAGQHKVHVFMYTEKKDTMLVFVYD
jgi:hypothetical protein